MIPTPGLLFYPWHSRGYLKKCWQRGIQNYPRFPQHHLSRGTQHTDPRDTLQPFNLDHHLTVRKESTASHSPPSPIAKWDPTSLSSRSAGQQHWTHTNSYRPLRKQPHSSYSEHRQELVVLRNTFIGGRQRHDSMNSKYHIRYTVFYNSGNAILPVRINTHLSLIKFKMIYSQYRI